MSKSRLLWFFVGYHVGILLFDPHAYVDRPWLLATAVVYAIWLIASASIGIYRYMEGN